MGIFWYNEGMNNKKNIIIILLVFILSIIFAGGIYFFLNEKNLAGNKIVVFSSQEECETVNPSCIYYLCDIPLGNLYQSICVDGSGTGWIPVSSGLPPEEPIIEPDTSMKVPVPGNENIDEMIVSEENYQNILELPTSGIKGLEIETSNAHICNLNEFANHPINNTFTFNQKIAILGEGFKPHTTVIISFVSSDYATDEEIANRVKAIQSNSSGEIKEMITIPTNLTLDFNVPDEQEDDGLGNVTLEALGIAPDNGKLFLLAGINVITSEELNIDKNVNSIPDICDDFSE